MTVWRLVSKEIGYRKLDFALGVLAVFVAVGSLVAVLTLLRSHDVRVLEMNAVQTEQTVEMLDLAKDDYRKLMKEMGYNLVILHNDEDLTEFFSNGFASKHMPEEYVTRLASSKIYTVQHLLPELYQNIKWPERDNCRIMLIGVRGEVPHLNANKGAVMLEPVERGTMRVGSALGAKLGIKAGQTATLMGKSFKVVQVHDERGTTDDIGVWIHLVEAQELLERPGQVNAILALSCVCAGGMLEQVRQEIAAILPEAHIIQRMSDAYIRFEARARVAALSKETAGNEAAYHASLNKEREAFASWLIPLVIIGATVWIGLLALGNVRARRTEIGTLRALGLRSRQILAVFLGKALLVGCVGGVLGYICGFIAGAAWGHWEGVPISKSGLAEVFDPVLLVCVLLLAPLQACLASWIPAMLATQQDPAVVLREE